MSKPAGFVFYVRDWLMSPSIRRMSDQQVRVYLNLLCYSWIEEPTATLPNDDLELAAFAGVPPETWNKIKGPILGKFQSDGNGRIFNEKLQSEARKCAQRSFAGKSGWTVARRKGVAKNGRSGGRPSKRKPSE